MATSISDDDALDRKFAQKGPLVWLRDMCYAAAGETNANKLQQSREEESSIRLKSLTIALQGAEASSKNLFAIRSTYLDSYLLMQAHVGAPVDGKEDMASSYTVKVEWYRK